MIIRVSAKMAKKLKVGPTQILPLDSNPYADWSTHLFTFQRNQYIMVTNTKSLYTMVMPGRGISSATKFPDALQNELGDFMKAEGDELIFKRRIEPAFQEVRFSKALNRSVTGSMNDLIFQSKVQMEYRNVAPHDLGSLLNEVPMSALGDHIVPNRAFENMAGE